MKKLYKYLRCPKTHQEFFLYTLDEAETATGGRLLPLRCVTSSNNSFSVPTPVGTTKEVLLRKDFLLACPIVDGTPILLIPEMLGINCQQNDFNFKSTFYEEAYNRDGDLQQNGY